MFRQDTNLNMRTQLMFHMMSSLHYVMAEPESDPDRMSDAFMDLILDGGQSMN